MNEHSDAVRWPGASIERVRAARRALFDIFGTFDEESAEVRGGGRVSERGSLLESLAAIAPNQAVSAYVTLGKRLPDGRYLGFQIAWKHKELGDCVVVTSPDTALREQNILLVHKLLQGVSSVRHGGEPDAEGQTGRKARWRRLLDSLWVEIVLLLILASIAVLVRGALG